MKFIPWLAALTVFAGAFIFPVSVSASEESGIALAIVYDTSGSMQDPVRDSSGKPSPKYIIANRALLAVAAQLQAFTTNQTDGVPLKLDTALFVFQGESGREAIKFGPFDYAALQNWAKTFSRPNGGTPIGNALNVAATAVLNSPLPHKHVLVITDGENTVGPAPDRVMAQLLQQAEKKQASLAVHFLAFDVNAKVFDPVKKLGATVVGASDETQLNTQLDFILQKKILLEAEEPVKKK